MKEKSLLSSFARYASMNVLGMVGLSCYILADTYFVAKGLGSTGLAALNLAIPVYSFLQGAGLMVGMGAATQYVLRREAGQPHLARQGFTRAVMYTALLASIFVLIGLFGAQQLTALLGGQGKAGEMTTVYLRTLLIGAPAFLFNNLLLCFVRNDGGPRLAMTAMLTGSFSNIVLDYVFIFILDMGMFGAVFATCLAPVIGLSVLSTWFIRKKNSFYPEKASWCWREIGTVSALGGPSLLSEVSAGVVMVVFNLLILSIEGEIGVAAYGVIANLSLVTLAIFTGLGQGAQPLVSRFCGRGELGQSRRVYAMAVGCGLLFAVVIYLLVLTWTAGIAALFNREGNIHLQQLAETGLRLYFIALPFAGLNAVTAVCFSAMDRPRPALLISLLRGFLLVLPLAIFMSGVWGMTGIWLAFPIAEGITAVVALIVLQWKKGKNFEK